MELNGSVNTKEIHEEIIKRWGDRSTVKRVLQMVTKTMEDFHFLKRVKTRPVILFEKVSKKKTDNSELNAAFCRNNDKSGEKEFFNT